MPSLAAPPPRRKKRVHTPTVLQMEAVECGAASLAMVLHYYDCHITLEELRVECGVSRDGSKAANILKAARKYGLIAKGYRKELQALYEVNLPVIIFWQFRHFLVLDGFDARFFYLNDPASGKRRVSHEEFDQNFTGIVLTFSLTPDFKKVKADSNLWINLAQRFVGAKSPFLFILCCGILLVVPEMAIPVFSRIFVDYYLIAGITGWIRPLLGAMVLFALLKMVLLWLREKYLLRIETVLSVSNSAVFLQHLLRLPMVFFFQRMSGDLANRLAMINQVAMLLSRRLMGLALSFFVILVYGGIMFFYDWALAVISLILASLNFILLYYFSRRVKESNMVFLTEISKLSGITMNGIYNIETIKATGAEADFFEKWSGFLTKSKNAFQRMGLQLQILSVLPQLLGALSMAVVLGLGSLAVMNGRMTLGMLVAFLSMMIGMMAPIQEFINLTAEIQFVKGNVTKINDILDYPPQIQVFSPTMEDSFRGLDRGRSRLVGEVEFRHISFGYNHLESPLIRDFNLHLTPGARVALVGASGSGKSTISKLLLGLFKPWEGDILLDGQPINEFGAEVLSHSLTMVDQDIFLFEGTIRENLTLWNPLVPDQDLVRAARDAEIHDVISARRGGYNSPINEGGANFSGGQRQRLEITRALALNPRIVVLDEATSALDPLTEKKIDDNIRRRGCTMLIIAHRLTTIRDCDEIIVLSDGLIVQRGTHNDLIRMEGPYSRLIAME